MKTKSAVIRISSEAKVILVKKREGFERPMDTLDRLLGVKKKK